MIDFNRPGAIELMFWFPVLTLIAIYMLTEVIHKIKMRRYQRRMLHEQRAEEQQRHQQWMREHQRDDRDGS